MNYVAVVMRAAELEKPNSDIASHTGTHCMHAHFLVSLNCVLYYIIIGKGWKTPTTFFDHLGGIQGILPLLLFPDTFHIQGVRKVSKNRRNDEIT